MNYFITVFDGDRISCMGGPYPSLEQAQQSMSMVMLRETEHAKMEQDDGKVVGWWSMDGEYSVQ